MHRPFDKIDPGHTNDTFALACDLSPTSHPHISTNTFAGEFTPLITFCSYRPLDRLLFVPSATIARRSLIYC